MFEKFYIINILYNLDHYFWVTFQRACSYVNYNINYDLKYQLNQKYNENTGDKLLDL